MRLHSTPALRSRITLFVKEFPTDQANWKVDSGIHVLFLRCRTSALLKVRLLLSMDLVQSGPKARFERVKGLVPLLWIPANGRGLLLRLRSRVGCVAQVYHRVFACIKALG